MGIMLWLEHFGLDEQRDKIQLQVIGDQSIQMQALENGTIDAAVLDGVFSRRLKQKGFNIVGEYSELKQLFTSQAIVVQGKFLQQRGDRVENLLKAQVEAIAFSLAPKNKPTVIRTFMRRLQSRRCRCRRRLCRSPSRHGPQTLSVTRRIAQRAAPDGAKKSESRRSQN